MPTTAKFPRMLRIKQSFETTVIDDVSAEVDRQLTNIGLGEKVQPGQTVAITVGSRGIANVATMTKAICDHVKAIGAVPIIIPAMGSHGGATAAGQRRIVEGYGVTEDYVGAEIKSSMDTVIVAETSQGIPVHFDRNAFEADHVVVFNRVKPHTSIVGDIESGLHKMMLIGLGKTAGAKIYHRAFMDYSFAEIVKSVADVVLKKCSVVCGLGVVENSLDQTGMIQAVRPQDFFAVECELLELSKQWLPKLPFSDIDLLIVDRIGKNISGTGMDTNIVGRKYNDNVAMENDSTRIRRIIVRSLTPETHGNATGIGVADFTTRRCVENIDAKTTAINCITALHPTAAAVPVTLENDHDCIEAALQTIGLVEPEDAKVVHILDTLHLEEVFVSEAFSNKLKSRRDLSVITEAAAMSFNSTGDLATTW